MFNQDSISKMQAFDPEVEEQQMTPAKAREILGEEADAYTDEELNEFIYSVDQICFMALARLRNRNLNSEIPSL